MMIDKHGTRDRILDAALHLFNTTGCHATTTNHVADAAGLSVGNLYYHFKNKEAIVRALYERLASATTEAFLLSSERLPDMADLERLIHANFELLWQYRFFYREIMALTQRDEQLAAQYQAVRQHGYANFVALFDGFQKSGVFRDATANEILNLAETAWILSEFYLAFVELGGEKPTETHRAHGMTLLRQTIAPYLNVAVAHAIPAVSGTIQKGKF